MNRVLVVIASAVLCLVFAFQAFSQSSNSALGGTVADQSGALIPGVTVTATNTQTGVVTSVITNETGAYSFASLQPGLYRVAAALPGFQTRAYDNFTLLSSEQKRLNFSLQVAASSTQVEVSVDASQLLLSSSSSVGQVLPESQVRELPLPNRDVLDLIGIMPGVSGEGATASFAGGRTNSINTTLDGLNTSSFRYENGVYSTARINPDLVGEIQIILAPVDAETGRGSGQVRILTKSGSNKYTGSVNWNVNNSAFNANSWANNAAIPRSVPNWANRHQLTATYGGPIIRSKTFFFAGFDGQRSYSRTTQSPLVLTEEARKGLFRFFPGVNNGNASSTTTGTPGSTNYTSAVVDYAGNPTRPAGATGDLQSLSVFNRDPNRPGFDSTGWIQKLIKDMPAANAWDGGGTDGLNTATYRWVRRTKGTDAFNAASDTTNRNQLNLKIDENFNSSHKLSVNWNWEHDWSQQAQSAWPNGFNGEVLRTTHLLTTSFTSTLTSSLVNEFRFGMNRLTNYNFAEYMNSETGKDALAYLPQINGIPVMVHPTSFNTHMLQVGTADSNGANYPIINWTAADSISWTKGKHAFKGGGEVRLFRTNGFNSERILPHAIGGAGNAAVPAFGISGMLANTEATMRNLLLTLNGSIASIQEAFTLNDPLATEFKDYKELADTQERPVKYRKYAQNEMAFFFKDDWKMSTSFTLNAGLRWEYYGVPYEAHGLIAAPVGEGIVAFGYSGRGFEDWKTFGPQKGELTTVQFVGPNSPNPDKSLYQRDLNNFSPNVGFSWTLPWFGENKTVIRGGYGIAYQGGGRALSIDVANSLPGLNQFATFTSPGFLNLGNIPIPVPNRNKPLQPSPVTERTQTFDTWDPHLVSPYIQNFNASLTRTLSRTVALEARYVGTRGVKLFGSIPINEVNIFNNGILEAFNLIRNGGDSPLVNKIFQNLNLGAGVTPSAYLRTNTNWRGFFANGNVGGFANRLNTSTEITGVAGGLLRNGGLPENFIAANPQFATVSLRSNPSSSSYHSLQSSVTLRPVHGFSYQGTYVWSKSIAIGTGDAFDDWRDATNRSLDKELQASHRSHDFRSNGTLELPIGPNKLLLGNSSGLLARMVERWQMSLIVNMTSGAPLNLTTGPTTNTQNNTPDIVGLFPRHGSAKKVSNLAVYLEGYTLPDDPQCLTLPETPQNLRAQCTNNAIAGADGQILLVNPQAGKLGTLGRRWIEGPGNFRFDAAARKVFRISESKEFQIRVDAQNVLNHPLLGNPTLDINSTNFGRITTASGTRTFAASARVSF